MTINSIIYSIENLMSNIILAVIVIFAGLVLGNILGNKVSNIVEKLGLDKTFKGSVIEKGVEAAGTTIPGLFNLVVRWFIYLIAVMLALNYLNIPLVGGFIQDIINYLPNVFAAMLILFVGLVIADFLGNLLKNKGESMGLPFIDIITPVLKFVLYFTVVMMVLDKLQVSTCIIYILSEAFVGGIGL